MLTATKPKSTQQKSNKSVRKSLLKPKVKRTRRISNVSTITALTKSSSSESLDIPQNCVSLPVSPTAQMTREDVFGGFSAMTRCQIEYAVQKKQAANWKAEDARKQVLDAENKKV